MMLLLLQHDRADLSAVAVLGGDSLPPGAWYCSAILQDDAPALAEFLGSTPFAVLEDEVGPPPSGSQPLEWQHAVAAVGVTVAAAGAGGRA